MKPVGTTEASVGKNGERWRSVFICLSVKYKIHEVMDNLQGCDTESGTDRMGRESRLGFYGSVRGLVGNKGRDVFLVVLAIVIW